MPTLSAIELRHATRDDAAALCAIYNPYVATTTISFEEAPVSADDMAQRIADVQAAGLPWLVALSGGLAIGYAYATRWRLRPAYRTSVASSVYLAGEAGGRGAGAAPYRAPLDALRLEDAAATLVAFTAEAVKPGFAVLGGAPTELIVCGGGRHNPVLMKAFAERLSVPVTRAEDHGWRGDAIEAEAFAYLAARTARGLPISFPKTTGVAAPMTGGRIARPTA